MSQNRDAWLGGLGGKILLLTGFFLDTSARSDASKDVSSRGEAVVEDGRLRARMMVAHCVNPNCGARLHSFAEGRLFQFEVVSISVSAADDSSAPFDEEPRSQTAQFWLCGRCATSLSLVLEPVSGLRIVPSGTECAGVKRLPFESEGLLGAHHC
jgi:hypothetical protein